MQRASRGRGRPQHLRGIDQTGCRRPGVRGQPLGLPCGAWGGGGFPQFRSACPRASAAQPRGPQQAVQVPRLHGERLDTGMEHGSCHSCVCTWPAWPLPLGAGVWAALSSCVRGPEARHLSPPRQNGSKTAAGTSSGGFCSGRVESLQQRGQELPHRVPAQLCEAPGWGWPWAVSRFCLGGLCRL